MTQNISFVVNINIMNGKSNWILTGFVILLILFALKKCFSQEVVKYTLSDVIEIAQEQSPDAMKARHSFRASYWEYRFFKATYLPSLVFRAVTPDLSRMYKKIDESEGSSYIFRNEASNSLELSLEQKIGLTGGTISLNSGISRLDNFAIDSLSYYSNIINVAINQPIFKYNSYKWEKRIEPMKFEAAKRILIEANESVASTTVDYFYLLLIAQLEKEIALVNYANYDTLYKIAQGRFELGKIAENELLQLELNLLKATSELENSELNYESRSFIFKSYLRIKDEIPIELIPPKNVPDIKISPNIAIDYALNNTSSGIEFQRRLLEAESEVDRARKEGRFDAELYAVLGLTQAAGDYLVDSYKNPKDEERISLGITIPILDWGKAKGQIKMAESRQDLVVTNVEQEIIDFNQNVFINVMEFNMQKNQLFIAAKSDTVAQKRFEVTQKRYMIGKINDVLELKNAQVDNDNAKIGYYNALKVYWKSYYEIRKLTHYDFLRDRPITVNYDDLLD